MVTNTAINDSRFREKFQPEIGFVEFLLGAFELANEIGIRFCPANFAIMCRNRGCRSKQLFTENLTDAIRLGKAR